MGLLRTLRRRQRRQVPLGDDPSDESSRRSEPLCHLLNREQLILLGRSSPWVVLERCLTARLRVKVTVRSSARPIIRTACHGSRVGSAWNTRGGGRRWS